MLLSELVAYAFLREQFKGDLRRRLLKAREEKYRQEVPDLYHMVETKLSRNGRGRRRWRQRL
jgi:hypothetical protein